MKSGLDYFSIDTCLDDKFALLEAEHGPVGFAIVIKLLQKIYGGQGYYCEWTDEVALLFSRIHAVEGHVVSQIVQTALKRGIFDKRLYQTYGILTSSGIQKRYLEAAKRRKRVCLVREYLLLGQMLLPDNVCIYDKDENKTAKNANHSEQRKEEQSNKEKRQEELPAAKPHGKRKNVLLTDEQVAQLRGCMGGAILLRYIDKVGTYLAKGRWYADHYATILAWWEQDGKPQSPPMSYDIEKFDHMGIDDIPVI